MKHLLAIILGSIMSACISVVTFGIKSWFWPSWPAMFLCGVIVTLLCIRVVKGWAYDDEEHGVVLWLLLQRACCEMSSNGLRTLFECQTGRTLSASRFYAIMATLEKDGKVSHRDEQDEHGTNRFYRAI